MAKVLRTHQVTTNQNVKSWVREEIILLTRNVPCDECVEILIERSLYDRLELKGTATEKTGELLGFRYRVVHGPGVRPGSLAVITRTEILFK